MMLAISIYSTHLWSAHSNEITVNIVSIELPQIDDETINLLTAGGEVQLMARGTDRYNFV